MVDDWTRSGREDNIPVPNRYECRRFARIPVIHPVVVTASEGKKFEATLQDISALGMYLKSSVVLPLRAECQVNFHYDPQKAVEVRGVVVRADKLGFAIEFSGVRADSVENLRQFIVSHAEDANSVDVEMISKIGDLPNMY
ncbi:MAG: PilZ domain-containing protein [Candidatus Hydrogenedentes bacterium]|nr:PilZ domain-containing protein [Candidatus Hydrogenedentota bacterium]